MALSIVTVKDFFLAQKKMRSALVGDEHQQLVTLREEDGADVALASKVGTLTETAPASDTASSGLNGRLQRIAQRLTTLLGAVSDAVSTHHLVTAGSVNAGVVKASAGNLRSVHVFSAAAYPVYVKFHNSASSPTAGAGVVLTVGVQAGQARDVRLPRGGRAFAAGIAVTVVKDIADTGTTAVLANDAVIEVGYD